MNQGIQSHLKHKQLHHVGCYLLSLIQAANCNREYTEEENMVYIPIYMASFI